MESFSELLKTVADFNTLILLFHYPEYSSSVMKEEKINDIDCRMMWFKIQWKE